MSQPSELASRRTAASGAASASTARWRRSRLLASRARRRRARARRRLRARQGAAGAQPRPLHARTRRSSAKPAAASRTRSSARCCSSRSRPLIALPVGVLSRSTSASSRRPSVARVVRLVARRAERPPVDRDRHLRLRAARPSVHDAERVRRRRSRSRSSCCRSSRARRRRCSRSSRSSLREASHALGVCRWRTVLGSSCRRRSAGSSPATTLAVARAAGETAPILFTSTLFTNSRLGRPDHPVAPMPSRSSRTPSRQTRTSTSRRGRRRSC